MADARDLLNAWQDALRGIRGVAAPATEAFEQVLRRQLDFEGQLVGRVLAPLNVVLDSLDGTAKAMRTQADALQAAAAAFQQSAELLDVQASLLEKAVEALRDPAEFVRSAGGFGER
jgi:hypothetical protein